MTRAPCGPLPERRTSESHSRRDILKAGAGLALAALDPFHVAAAMPAHGEIRWVVFYGMQADEATLAAYDLLVLDAGFDGPIERFTSRGKAVCGYLSLAEIRTSDPLFNSVDPAALLEENPDWRGTRRVDIRHPAWRRFVVEQQIPLLLARGFNGLMLDTLDTPPHLEQIDPVRFKGMRQAAIDLVDSIRSRWPGLILVMNRGYVLLPDLLQSIDAIIAESLVATSDSRSGGFTWVDKARVDLQLQFLEPAAKRFPRLPILSLDYWNPQDIETIAAIYRAERTFGHHPYVATRLLDRIVPEPR